MNLQNNVLIALKRGTLTQQKAEQLGIKSLSSAVSKLRAKGYVITCVDYVYKLEFEPPQFETAKKKRMKTALEMILASPGISFHAIRENLGIDNKSSKRYALMADLDGLVCSGKVRITREGGRNNYWPPYDCTVLNSLYAPKPSVKVKQTRHIKEVAWKVQTHRATPSIQSPFSSVYFGM